MVRSGQRSRARGHAGFADEAEARAALNGRGGRPSNLDGGNFDELRRQFPRRPRSGAGRARRTAAQAGLTAARQRLRRARRRQLRLGYYCPLNGEEVGAPLLSITERHSCLFGLNGAGKSTRFLIELLATACNRSLLVFDIKGELA